MNMTAEDNETLRRLRVLRKIEANPDKWPKSMHKEAVDKLNQVRLIVGQKG